jgi:phosphohistidine swiveling domain-containing protein
MLLTELLSTGALGGWELGSTTLPVLQTYAGAFLAAPILFGALLLSIVALFAGLIVAFGFLGQTLAIVAASVTVAALASGSRRLLRSARRRLPAPSVIRLGGPLALEPLTRHVGAKAAQLAALMGRQQNVPAALALGTGLFARVARGLGLAALPVENRADAVLSEPWPRGARRALRRALRSIGPERLIVRSSFVEEGGADACAAGLYTSVRNVDAADEAAVERAVRQVYASYWSAEARGYRAAMGISEPAMPQLAVLLQRQMAHDLRGHAASLDPATGRDDRVRVEAVDGSGRSAGWFLSGEVASDLTGPDADHTFRPAAQGLATALSSAVRTAEDCLGGPVEIEWGVADGELCLYQARPLTHAHPHLVYSNGVHGDAISRVLSPLSESVLIDGIGWRELLSDRLRRLGLGTVDPPAARHEGRWYLLEAPWRRLHRLPASAGTQLRLLREAAMAALFGRRLIARAGRQLRAAEDSGDDPRPVFVVLRQLVELDHKAGLASDALRSTAQLLGASGAAFGAAAVGNRRALLLEALGRDPGPSADELAERFGDLADDDLELSVPRYREIPDEAFRKGNHAPLGPHRERPSAELSGGRRALAWMFLRPALSLARLREECRARIDRANGILRRQALSFQERAWETPSVPDAVFLLRVAEWTAALDGAPTPDLDVLRARAEQWREDEAADRTDRIVVRPDGRIEDARSRPATAGVFRGLGASPGRCSGPTLCLPSKEPVDGKIVLLPDADGRWLRQLIGAKAVVLRSGGILSHLAMVVRDLGLPCVLAPGLVLPDGARILVDGDRGEIHLPTAAGAGSDAP